MNSYMEELKRNLTRLKMMPCRRQHEGGEHERRKLKGRLQPK